MLTLSNPGCRIVEQRKSYRDLGESRRQHEAGYQDRLRGLAPHTDNADYFRGYCEAVCNEISAETGWFKPAKRIG